MGSVRAISSQAFDLSYKHSSQGSGIFSQPDWRLSQFPYITLHSQSKEKPEGLALALPKPRGISSARYLYYP
jgi:hypothetical protein